MAPARISEAASAADLKPAAPDVHEQPDADAAQPDQQPEAAAAPSEQVAGEDAALEQAKSLDAQQQQEQELQQQEAAPQERQPDRLILCLEHLPANLTDCR